MSEMIPWDELHVPPVAEAAQAPGSADPNPPVVDDDMGENP